MEKKFGAFSSSVNPEQLSARVTGIMVALTTIVLFLAAKLGVNITAGEWQSFIANVGNLILVGGPAISAGLLVFGQIRSWVSRLLAK